MLSMVFVVLAGGVEMAKDRAELNAAVATMKRLAASACVPMPGEKASNALERKELVFLMKWVDKFLEQTAQRAMAWTEGVNFLQVCCDAKDMGTYLSTLPEEQLCWLRAYLNLVSIQVRIMKRMPLPPSTYTQSDSIASIESRAERVRKRYHELLAQCAVSK